MEGDAPTPGSCRVLFKSEQNSRFCAWAIRFILATQTQPLQAEEGGILKLNFPV